MLDKERILGKIDDLNSYLDELNIICYKGNKLTNFPTKKYRKVFRFQLNRFFNPEINE